eukprot:g2474.t1
MIQLISSLNARNVETCSNNHYITLHTYVVVETLPAWSVVALNRMKDSEVRACLIGVCLPAELPLETAMELRIRSHKFAVHDVLDDLQADTTVIQKDDDIVCTKIMHQPRLTNDQKLCALQFHFNDANKQEDETYNVSATAKYVMKTFYAVLKLITKKDEIMKVSDNRMSGYKRKKMDVSNREGDYLLMETSLAAWIRSSRLLGIVIQNWHVLEKTSKLFMYIYLACFTKTQKGEACLFKFSQTSTY